MHIPNGVLDPATTVAACGRLRGRLTWSAYELRSGRPRMGLRSGGAGGLLVAHLADVPLYGPYTSHLIGGTLLAIAVGPLAGADHHGGGACLRGVRSWATAGTARWARMCWSWESRACWSDTARIVRSLAIAATACGGARPKPSLWTAASAAAVGAWLSVMASALTLAWLVAMGGNHLHGRRGRHAATPASATYYPATPPGVCWRRPSPAAVVIAAAAWTRSVTRIESAVDVRASGASRSSVSSRHTGQIGILPIVEVSTSLRIALLDHMSVERTRQRRVSVCAPSSLANRATTLFTWPSDLPGIRCNWRKRTSTKSPRPSGTRPSRWPSMC